MNKLLKTVGITLASIVGVVVITIAVAIWCVFTPERLTPVVRQVADRYITCEWDIGDVDLTFFSTFPEFGLHIDGVRLINPMKGAPTDTVLTAPSVVAKVDVMAFLKRRSLIVHELSLPDVEGHIYINAAGESNLSVFATRKDTTATDSTFTLPFDTLIVEQCQLQARQLSLQDDKDTISASLHNTRLELAMHTWDCIHLQLASEDVCARIKGETYASHLPLSLDLPAAVDLETMHVHLDEAQVEVNELKMTIQGDVTLADTIAIDATVQLADWHIQSVLALIPASMKTSLQDIDVDGYLTLSAHAKGIYTEGSLPRVDAQLSLSNGRARYAQLPYTFTGIGIDASTHLDFNCPQRSVVRIARLSARTLESSLQLRGQIDDVMGEMRTQAHVQLDASIPDWRTYLPDSLELDGRVQATLDVSTRVADLMAERLDRTSAKGTLQLNDMYMAMDSMQIQLDEGQLNMDLQLAEWPVIKATLDLQSEGTLRYHADTTDATITAPHLSAYAAYHTQDTTLIPTFQASIAFNELKGHYGTSSAQMGKSEIEAQMTHSMRRESVPVFTAKLNSGNIVAHVGDNHISTQLISMDAKAFYNKTADKFLLQWNPIMKFSLWNAHADLAELEQHVRVPQIAFKYSNRKFDILSSSVVLGQSDFALTGQINHIGKWLMKKGELTGELNFTSNHTDVNELMNLLSADAGSEETESSQTADADRSQKSDEAEPFLVPTDVDLILNTYIGEAVIFNQVAKNLGGKIYIKEGTLVLEEMGFVCDAAKLQLTAMYRTPRRNHLYVGFDYHMMDVKIDQLIHMIPQLDSMMPMLNSFKGEAEFHLAAETYLKSNYEIKQSTLRGACSIFGKDLVVMDSETFDKISKILMFKKKTENRVDSISAEITLYKDEIDIYPFCVSMDNYMVALGGKHNLDMSFDYHINLLSPLYIGVDVKGTLDNLSIKPAKCVYAKDFKPIIHHNVDNTNAEFRKQIRESLRKNVKIQ